MIVEGLSWRFSHLKWASLQVLNFLNILQGIHSSRSYKIIFKFIPSLKHFQKQWLEIVCFKVGQEPSKLASGIVSSLTPPLHTFTSTMERSGLARPGEHLRLCPLLLIDVPRWKKVAQMKEKIKDPKIELSNEEITNLSDAELKSLVIRMKWLRTDTK